MRVLTMCRRAAVAGIAAGLAVGPAGAEVAAPAAPAVAAITQAAAGKNIVAVRAVRVRVPRGILAGVPTGGDPYWASRPQPYPVLSPLAAWALVPPVVFVPPMADVWPADFAPIDFGPIGLGPFGFGPCFVPTEHTGQHGYYGSCADSFYQQYTNRPD